MITLKLFKDWLKLLAYAGVAVALAFIATLLKKEKEDTSAIKKSLDVFKDTLKNSENKYVERKEELSTIKKIDDKKARLEALLNFKKTL